MAKRIDDLEEWGEDVKARIRTLPQPLQAAARESTRMLLPTASITSTDSVRVSSQGRAVKA